MKKWPRLLPGRSTRINALDTSAAAQDQPAGLLHAFTSTTLPVADFAVADFTVAFATAAFEGRLAGGGFTRDARLRSWLDCGFATSARRSAAVADFERLGFLAGAFHGRLDYRFDTGSGALRWLSPRYRLRCLSGEKTSDGRAGLSLAGRLGADLTATNGMTAADFLVTFTLGVVDAMWD
jgi:hypothetical protein